MRFDPYNVMIHGITEDDVRDKPEFHRLWPEIFGVLRGRPWVAHNAAFDFSVLRQTFDKYGFPYPEVAYCCTYQMAKKAWPGLLNYSLPTVAAHVGVEFKHHDPEEDAAACAQLALLSARKCGAAEIVDCAERLNIRMGALFPGGFRASSVRSAEFKASDLVPNAASFDESHPYFDRTFVFTGTLQSMVRRDAMQRVFDLGGRCADSVTAATAYLVVGDQDLTKFRGGDKSGKMRKAEQTLAKGGAIELLSEEEFLRLL
jgi:DNA polymerase-3 subunit epsilon